MSRRRKSADLLGSDEQMMPFISIAFLLLIFCLIAGSIESRAPVPFDPPLGEGSETAASGLPPLYLAADGVLWFESKEVTLEGLPEALGPHLEEQDDKRLQIKADAKSDTALLIALLAKLRELGIEQAEVMTEADGS